MSGLLSLTLVQTALYWEEPEKNFDHFESLFNKNNVPTDVFILPEMFTTGFSMQPEKCANGLFEKCLYWMHTQAKDHNAAIVGSTMVKVSEVYYNRLIWMPPDGEYRTYDKKHLFSYGDEQNHYTAGDNRLIVEYKGWRICPLICYDLRFPVWCRNTIDYDLLIFLANWPDRRIYAWDQLLIARAIENVCYVAGVNRVGNDGNGIYHSGHSAFVDYMGKQIWTEANDETIHTLIIEKQPLTDFRKAFTALNDRDTIPREFYMP